MQFKLWILKFASNYWLFGILIFLVGADICCHISCFVVTSESIVLTFVGILATLVVVGNYAQVKAIENKMDEKIQKLEFDLLEVKKIKEDMDRKFNHSNEKETIKMYLTCDTLNSEYRKSIYYNSFEVKAQKSDFYFVQLLEKFPDMTGRELRKLIQTYLVQP